MPTDGGTYKIAMKVIKCCGFCKDWRVEGARVRMGLMVWGHFVYQFYPKKLRFLYVKLPNKSGFIMIGPNSAGLGRIIANSTEVCNVILDTPFIPMVFILLTLIYICTLYIKALFKSFCY